MRIWTKLIKKEKILQDNLYELPLDWDINRLRLYISDICNELDVSTPILLQKHYEQLYLFKSTTFTPSDFIDTCKFDKMVCELVSTDNAKNIKLFS